jgi:hypothetical protein
MWIGGVINRLCRIDRRTSLELARQIGLNDRPLESGHDARLRWRLGRELATNAIFFDDRVHGDEFSRS